MLIIVAKHFIAAETQTGVDPFKTVKSNEVDAGMLFPIDTKGVTNICAKEEGRSYPSGQSTDTACTIKTADLVAVRSGRRGVRSYHQHRGQFSPRRQQKCD